MDESFGVRSELPPPAADVGPAQTRPPPPPPGTTVPPLAPLLPPPRAPLVDSGAGSVGSGSVASGSVGSGSVGSSDDDTPPHWTQDDETRIDWTGGATTLQWDLDETTEQLPQSIRSGNGFRARWLSEDAFQSLRRHLSTLAFGMALAIPVAVAAFIGLASVRSGFDGRQFWASQRHSFQQFWYVLVLFVAALTPVTFSALRRGLRAAQRLVVEHRYWKVLLIAFVGVPVLGAVVMFAAGHVMAVLVVLAALLLIVVITGGF